MLLKATAWYVILTYHKSLIGDEIQDGITTLKFDVIGRRIQVTPKVEPRLLRDVWHISMDAPYLDKECNLKQVHYGAFVL